MRPGFRVTTPLQHEAGEDAGPAATAEIVILECGRKHACKLAWIGPDWEGIHNNSELAVVAECVATERGDDVRCHRLIVGCVVESIISIEFEAKPEPRTAAKVIVNHVKNEFVWNLLRMLRRII